MNNKKRKPEQPIQLALDYECLVGLEFKTYASPGFIGASIFMPTGTRWIIENCENGIYIAKKNKEREVGEGTKLSDHNGLLDEPLNLESKENGLWIYPNNIVGLVWSHDKRTYYPMGRKIIFTNGELPIRFRYKSLEFTVFSQNNLRVKKR